MKIILTSVGTRGDMEPFLAIGQLLKAKGHQVICAFPEQFRLLAEDAQLEFASLGSRFIELLEGDIGKAAMGGSSGFKKFRAIIKLAQTQKASQQELIKNQYDIIEKENPDRVIYNGKAIYPMIWEIQNPGKTVYVSPIPFMHYVKGHTHVVFNSNFGHILNKWTFALAHFGIVTTVLTSKKWLHISEKISRSQIRNILQRGKTIYTISPALLPRPDYWHKNLKVLGHQEIKNAHLWQPDRALSDFMQRHQKILFITFGSMINPEPYKKTQLILDILIKNKIPAIINTAGGGLIQPDHFSSDLIYFVSEIPYDWVFTKVYAVMHHGGSGTTHLALKYGCASMIIPHIIDQYVWNKIIHDLGAGPGGIKIGRLTRENIEPMMLELMGNAAFKKKAMQISEEMQKEDFKEDIHQAIIEGSIGWL